MCVISYLYHAIAAPRRWGRLSPLQKSPPGKALQIKAINLYKARKESIREKEHMRVWWEGSKSCCF